MKLVAFCEAAADFRLMSGLVDRALQASEAAWVVDNFGTPDVIRTWHSDGRGNLYFDIHHLNDYADMLRKRGLGVRRVRGHFDGRPGEPGGAMARKAFLIAEALHKKSQDPVDAVVLLWDTDQEPDQRPEGVKAARTEAQGWAPFQIVCGFPDPEREAWVLAGFEPSDEAERQLLEQLHRDLGFSPVLHARRLRDKSDGALRNIKRVLGVLVGDDPDREARCWTEAPFERLRGRGHASGLTAFLDDLDAALRVVLGLRAPDA